MSQKFRNSEFLLKISPIKVTLLAFSIWAILFFTAPIEVRIEVSWGAYVLMGAAMGAFLLASKIPARPFKAQEIKIDRLKSVFQVVLIIACMGLAFKAVDRILIRGISFNVGNMMNRDLMASGSGNPIGILASVLSPFSYIPLFIVWKYKLKLWPLLKWLAYLVFFTQIFDAILLGSRSIIFVNLIILLLYLVYFKKIILKFRTYILLAIGLFGIVVFMNYMFVQRTKEFFGDEVYDLVLNESNFNFTSTASQDFKREFSDYGEVRKSIAFTYIVTTQYFTHGMLEFPYLYSEFSSDYTYGRYTFDLYFRFLDKVSPSKISMGDPEDILPRSGVYTTLLGPLFVDFGWFVVGFMFFFGRVVKTVYTTALRGTDWAIIMYFYFFLILAFWPVFNFLSGAGGMFTLTSITIFALMSSYIYGKKVT